MESLGILVADAAHHGLGQGDGADAHQYPLGEVEGQGHMACRQRLEHLWMVCVEGGHDVFIAAASLEHIVQQHDDARHHHQSAAGICESHGAETADGGVEYHRQAEEKQAHLIAVACDGREQLGSAHELGGHGSAEEQHYDEGGQACQPVRIETGPDDVHHGDRLQAAGEQGHPLAVDAQHQEDGSDLHHCHVDPAKANLPGHPRPAHEGGNGAIGGHRGHGQHKAPKIMIAYEIRFYEARASAFAPHIEADADHQGHEDQQRQKSRQISHCIHSLPFFTKGWDRDMSLKTNFTSR